MKVLGIDPGINATGYGVVETQNGRIRLVETGSIEPKKRDSFQNRLNKIYTLLGDIIHQYQPDVLVLEKLYAHHKHPITASQMGHVRGVICLLCAQKNVELVEHSVKRIRKSLVGNGNATKQQTQKMVAHTFHIDGSQLTLDASDALALALGYVYMNGRVYDR